MDLLHLLNLVSELPENVTYKYVRGTDTCKFINVDISGERINAETSTGESKSWAPSYLSELAPKIKENVPFNLSSLLNNKGSYRPILETIIAHTKEFYTVKNDKATLLVWIPSKPKNQLQLEGIPKNEIPVPVLTDDDEEKVLSTPELVNKFKESFIQYWKIVDQHGVQCEAYVKTFEEEMNQNISNLNLDISNVFEIINYSQYCKIINQITKEYPQMGFLNEDNAPTGLNYRVWSTNRQLKNYLEILSISKFLTKSQQITKNSKLSPSKDNSQILVYLAAMRTKPFMLLAGISGTGKSRIVRKLAQATVPKNLQESFDGETRTKEGFKEERWTLHRPANFELIQVKPNWHNSMDVVGYLSNIPSPHYVFTPFINFIVRAMCHPEVPFFLCLDEMNLAPVEEYFAEFLSAIESRAVSKDGYMTDPIIPPFKNYGEVKDDKGGKRNVGEDMLDVISTIIKNEMISDEKRGEILTHLEERGVTLPKNLIIVGTVNMDETTFSFSRKVLDRAMSMEMNKVDYSSFLLDTTDNDIKAIAEAYDVDGDATGEKNELNRLLVDRHIEAKEVVGDLGGAAEGSDAWFVIDYLETINKLLDGTPFKLGYRAANEALIYLQSTKDFGSNDRSAAMDRFTLMKILSRIEGDESKLKLTEADRERLTGCGVDFDKISGELGGATLLSAMREIISNRLGENETLKADDGTEDAEIEGEETQTPTESLDAEAQDSIKKLDTMIGQLDRDHFVSYWS